MDYVITVNDNGELKTISATEFENDPSGKIAAFMAHHINILLDLRSLASETQEPLQNGYPRSDPRSGIWRD